MQRNGTPYILLFSLVVCVVCSAMVCGVAYALREQQERNVVLDQRRNILAVAGLTEPGAFPPGTEIDRLFEESVRVRYVDLATGAYADDEVPAGYDMVAATKTQDLSQPAPPNAAGVMRLPKYGVVYEVVSGGAVEKRIIQAWGQGLWSTMYAYLALGPDGVTIEGLTFYEQGETPGLGGEVDNPKWKASWKGRKAFDEGGPAIVMRKGGAGSPEEDPHGFDGLSGATITSRGVEHLLNFWIGEHGYGPFLDALNGAADGSAA